ncbi:NAD-dependent epimerase/dehydratase family protein [Moraxella pluranimalium]|uniref:NAD-dependent epimerase/dehydratase domain-containing protein n=1 Tax=Moraxella pluranimalium TaxID=470453 RepID=A0A1T0CTE9_9GAMM|nr:NAD-dependent epimerase/dehydratase family protein [Moraxella pluranimalium]OOS25614.1 hypothetical protein B0680_01945 [Moraxella pluranimalium]
MKRFLIIGQGSIGKPLAERLTVHGQVMAVATSTKAYQAPVTLLQKPAQTLTADDICGVTHIAIIITPRKQGKVATADDYKGSYLSVCQSVTQLYRDSASQVQLEQVLFVSSTAVYGENAGEWIDERTPAVPTSPTAQVLLQAEQALQSVFGDKAVIVRPSGIYHLGSTRLIEQAKSAHHAGVPSHHYTNRIMDSDLIAILERILMTSTPKPIYLATDTLPVTSFDVLSFIADTLGHPPPTPIDGAMTGKRIRHNLPDGWLAVPDYRVGYGQVMAKMAE